MHQATRAVVLAAGAIAFALFAAPLVAGRVYFERDTLTLSACAYAALRDALHSGAGLLSSTLGNGVSLAAYPEAHALYPPAWPVLGLAAEAAFSWVIVFHLAVGAAAAAALARSFAVRAPLALGAGITWVFTGPVLDLVTHGVFVVAAAWLPLGWWGARRLCGHRPARGVIGVVVAVAGALLGAEPQCAGTIIAIAALEVTVAIVRRRSHRRTVLVTGARWALAMVAGVALGLVAWWEQLGQAALLTRPSGIALAEATHWSVDGASAVAVLVPGALHWGADAGTPLAALIPAQAQQVPWIVNPYLGALLVATAVVGATQRRALTATALALGAMLLALGSATPLYALAWRFVPLFDHFRYPAKYLVPATLGLVVLAAVGLEHAARAPAGRRFARLSWGVAIVVVGAVVARWTPSAPALVLLAAVFPLVAALAYAPRSRAVAALLLATSVVVVAPQQLQIEAPFAPMPSILSGVAAQARRGGHVRPVVCIEPRLERRLVSAGDDDDAGSAAMRRAIAARAWLAQDTPVLDGLAAGMAYSATARTAVAHALGAQVSAGDVRAARALGCTYVIGEPPAGAGSTMLDAATALGPAGDYPEGVPVRPFAIEAPVPAVFVARDPVVTPTDQVVARLVSGDGDPVAVIDDPLARAGGRALPSGAGVVVSTLDWQRRDRATVGLQGTGGAVVGIRTLFIVGWRARQAGVELPLVRASGSFPAAVVDDVARGPVELFFEPVASGRAVASLLVGVGALALALALARTRGTRTARRERTGAA
ncbi:MAG: hypothetical protein IT383_11235 [Deltaproteobacteria bacterium]|nr:hypothetical protein [Deltaproteobacteria bacterium]